MKIVLGGSYPVNYLRPAAPGWLPNWANGKLVVIDIEQQYLR